MNIKCKYWHVQVNSKGYKLHTYKRREHQITAVSLSRTLTEWKKKKKKTPKLRDYRGLPGPMFQGEFQPIWHKPVELEPATNLTSNQLSLNRRGSLSLNLRLNSSLGGGSIPPTTQRILWRPRTGHSNGTPCHRQPTVLKLRPCLTLLWNLLHDQEMQKEPDQNNCEPHLSTQVHITNSLRSIKTRTRIPEHN